jgi:predicted dinucleotide-binding enzyme
VEQSIQSKNTAEKVNNISVSDIKKTINKLTKQKKFLDQIILTINNINTPNSLEKSIVSQKQSTASLMTGQIVNDPNVVNIFFGKSAHVIKDDNDRHILRVVAS